MNLNVNASLFPTSLIKIADKFTPAEWYVLSIAVLRGRFDIKTQDPSILRALQDLESFGFLKNGAPSTETIPDNFRVSATQKPVTKDSGLVKENGTWEGHLLGIKLTDSQRKLSFKLFDLFRFDKTRPYDFILDINAWCSGLESLDRLVGKDYGLLTEAMKQLDGLTITTPYALLKTVLSLKSKKRSVGW